MRFYCVFFRTFAIECGYMRHSWQNIKLNLIYFARLCVYLSLLMTCVWRKNALS